MELTGELAAKLEIDVVSEQSGLAEVRYSCEWCSGSFKFFNSDDGLAELDRLCGSIADGRKKGHWISELGDLDLTFVLLPTGAVRTTVICSPSMGLAHAGRAEFTVDFGLADFDQQLPSST